MMMNGPVVLVTGAGGQLGRALAEAVWPDSYRTICLSREQLDIADPDMIAQVFAQHRPDVVVNAAAYTDVVGAQHEPELAYRINAQGAEHLAAQAQSTGAAIVHVSTDFVFGDHGPHDEKAVPSPLNIYGDSKLEGERAVLRTCSRAVVVRTAWVFDALGPNFVTKLLQRSDQPSLSVVKDEIGSPTSARHLAQAIVVLVEVLNKGQMPTHPILHVVNHGQASRLQMAQVIFDRWSWHTGRSPRLDGVPASQFSSVVRRPRDSRLIGQGLMALTGHVLPMWSEAVIEVVDAIAAASLRGQP